MGEAFVTRFTDAGPEGSIVKDMGRKALMAGPVLVLAFGLIWGIDGALSTAYGIAIVIVNFILAAALLAYAARISVALMMFAALFGYLLRLTLVFLAIWLVRDAA